MNHSNELSNVEKIKQLVDYLNLQRNAYYNAVSYTHLTLPTT